MAAHSDAPLGLIDLPLGSEAARAISPAYRTREPVVVNAELIPADVRQQMSAAWDRRFVPEAKVSLHRLTDCFVLGEGLVFDRTHALFRASFTQHTMREAEAERERLHAATRANVLRSLSSALLCCKRGAANYGHWLVEMLPMAHMGLRWQLPEETKLLVPAEPLAAVIRDSLGGLGVSAARLVPCCAPVHVQELFLVTGLSAHGTALSPFVLEALDAVVADIRPGPFDTVWVSREAEPRRIADETALCRALYDKGWTIAAPALFPFAQQVALFKGARRIAGVCGAGLANLVFAPRGASVTSFAPANMPDTLYWLLCELGGKQLREIRCPLQDGTRGTEPWDARLAVSLPEVLAELGQHPTKRTRLVG
ncbi:MAG: glycosyltransferase family 61 protein [Acetobacteraceae bacterium]|nr:glycosyltransferase family 61 protein [Acetobacteraceae bacterium]